MHELRSEIDIAAPAVKVWDILTNFNTWQEWNPIVNHAHGDASLNSKLSITMRGNNGKDGPKYKPNITNLDKPTFFRWRAKMMAGFIFTNDKVFELKETGTGTRLIHKELFSGLLVKMFWNKLNNHVPSMLKSMNEAIKMLAEKK
jgi:hypothetical protein